MLTNHRAHRARDVCEHAVPDGVTQRVVDPLEVVDVHQREAQPVPVALGAGDLVCDALVERAPVREPGELVVGREPLQLLLVAHALGDVADRPQRCREIESTVRR